MEAHNGKCISRYILHHKLRRARLHGFVRIMSRCAIAFALRLKPLIELKILILLSVLVLKECCLLLKLLVLICVIILLVVGFSAWGSVFVNSNLSVRFGIFCVWTIGFWRTCSENF